MADLTVGRCDAHHPASIPKLAESQGFALFLPINRQIGRARETLAIKLDGLPTV